MRLLIITGMLLCNSAQAQPGCLDNSKHLTERFDNKEMYPVECACPCYRYKQVERNKCTNCRHFHHAQYEMLPQSVAQEQQKRNAILGL